MLLLAVLAAAVLAGCGGEPPGAGDRPGDPAAPPVRRVVLVTFDTLHVDLSGPYNPAVDHTPHLDRLAAGGVVFEHAYTRVPLTVPSHASMLTGRPPTELAVMDNGDRLAAPAETLAEILGRHGYRTAAFVSLGVLGPNANLTQGFEHYDAEGVGPEASRWYRRADEVLPAARRWIEEEATERFLLWVHFSDPHEPYVTRDAPPDLRLELDGSPVGEWTLAAKERSRATLVLEPGRHRLVWRPLREPHPDDRPSTALILRLREPAALAPFLEGGASVPEEVALGAPWTVELVNRTDAAAELAIGFTGYLRHAPPAQVLPAYDRLVAWADQHFGELRALFERMGIAGDTLWVVASDHGEGLFRHRSIGHASNAQEDQLRVMWLMAGPGVPVGRRLGSAPVLLEDLAPTVLAHLGLAVPGSMSGRPQNGCWTGAGCAGREEWWAYGVRGARGRITAVAGYRWPYKLLWQLQGHSGGFELLADPWEESKLVRLRNADDADLPAELTRLNKRYPEARAALERALASRQREEHAPEVKEMLEALGYLGN